MNKLLRLKKVIASLLVAGVVVPAMFQAASLHAQDSSDIEKQKVNLMLAALDAKESGDLTTAKARYERILQLDPNDSAAKDGLDEVNRTIAAQNPKPTTGGFSFEAPLSTPTNTVSAPEAPPAPKTALDRVAQRNDALYNEVQSALVEAKQQADAGNTARAIQLIDGATTALPDNTGSQDLKARLSLLRQQIITMRDSGGEIPLERDAQSALSAEAGTIRRAAAEAMKLVDEAKSQIKKRQLDDAEATLAKATQILPRSIATVPQSDEIRKAQSMLLAVRMHDAIQARDINTAERYLNDYGRLNGESDKGYMQLKAEFEEIKADARYMPISVASPGFEQKEEKVQKLLTKGRAQYLYGDYEGALSTFKDALQYQTYNTEAKAHIVRIKNILSRSSAWNRNVTKQDLMDYVDNGWVLPGIYDKDTERTNLPAEADPVYDRLKKTIIPTITLRDAPLSRAIETLMELSVMYDPEQKGINMVTIDPENKNPNVSITMKNVSLDRLLEFVTKSASFNYSVNNGIIEVRPDLGSSEVETEILPITTGAIVKMTGLKGNAGGNDAANPFGGGGGGSSELPEESAIKSFLQRSGIPFDTVSGSALSFSGSELIVTQNRRNLEKIKNILRRYADTKQVHIESKFLEVTEGALKQLSSNWIVQRNRNGTTEVRARTGLRNLSDTFGSSGVSVPGQIITTPSSSSETGGSLGETITMDIPNSPPAFPMGNTGPTDPTFDGVIGSIGHWDLRLVVSALEENEGSDLMAAPSVTVVSGESATITIAQKLRYPESYGDIQSNVGSSSGGYNSNSSGSGASVTITAGTPQDFREEEVGVKLTVTPTVMDGGLIKLDLFPKVVEFEGFVEYGGTSVAIAGNTTVTVPSGFFQPVFSVREVMTKVEIFDGATVVIGGLTREEVKTVNDKVPVLGDLPVIGAMFQSNGRSSTKKNLMVFVTANLISPGGSMAKNRVGPINPGTVFSNPQVLTPGGPVPRDVIEPATTTATR
ncbi:MAG: hypothetical protein LBV12_01980 [Puniceicoccales bacterium]|jgi:general secretion pathway protein D|nr:hypothetical protein [Puniceicoccales bacterium]